MSDPIIVTLRELYKASELARSRLQSLSENLLGVPEKLRHAREAAGDAKQMSKLSDAMLESRELEVRSEVLGRTKEGTDKLAFTNDAQRNAEVKRVLSDDGVYKTLQADAAGWSRRARMLDLDAQRIEDERRAIEFQINALVSEDQLIVSNQSALCTILTHQKAKE